MVAVYVVPLVLVNSAFCLVGFQWRLFELLIRQAFIQIKAFTTASTSFQKGRKFNYLGKSINRSSVQMSEFYFSSRHEWKQESFWTRITSLFFLHSKKSYSVNICMVLLSVTSLNDFWYFTQKNTTGRLETNNIFYHIFYLFFPKCKRKELKLFQLLEN